MKKDQRRKRGQAGFTLIELLVVVTIIGILAGIAIVQQRYAVRKAQEAALRSDLFEMRKAIDNFHADKQRYPTDLSELVPGYLRRVPVDPMTKSADWETVQDSPTLNRPCVTDVKSRAQGTTIDNVPYNEL